MTRELRQSHSRLGAKILSDRGIPGQSQEQPTSGLQLLLAMQCLCVDGCAEPDLAQKH